MIWQHSGNRPNDKEIARANRRLSELARLARARVPAWMSQRGGGELVFGNRIRRRYSAGHRAVLRPHVWTCGQADCERRHQHGTPAAGIGRSRCVVEGCTGCTQS